MDKFLYFMAGGLAPLTGKYFTSGDWSSVLACVLITGILMKIGDIFEAKRSNSKA